MDLEWKSSVDVVVAVVNYNHSLERCQRVGRIRIEPGILQS